MSDVCQPVSQEPRARDNQNGDVAATSWQSVWMAIHLGFILPVALLKVSFAHSADRSQVLAEQLLEADAGRFVDLFPKLHEHAKSIVPFLSQEIDRNPLADSDDEDRERQAKRQANAAVVLLKLHQPGDAWPLFKNRVDPRMLIRHLDEEGDISVRRALLLSLGEFDETHLPREIRQSFLPKLREIYCSDADSGLHAAAEWLLRQLQQEKSIKGLNSQWATTRPHLSQKWYVNSQGQPMVVINGAVEFMMGSPTTEACHQDDERQHSRRINRSFALAAKSVTREQYQRYSPKHLVHDKNNHIPDSPVENITWDMAVTYCNWLSKQEGLPEQDWYYEIRGKKISLKENCLNRTGYRLPTVAEMEYATVVKNSRNLCRRY